MTILEAILQQLKYLTAWSFVQAVLLMAILVGLWAK